MKDRNAILFFGWADRETWDTVNELSYQLIK
jgi:hypothetical protein